MKKIININLSGRVIPIEDSAYEKLQAYVESLRRYFAHEEGRDEIINDIESRIAELMNEKIRKGAACITDTDIDEIIASMGRPEDFDAETAEAAADTGRQNSSQEYTQTGKKTKGRLYRDGSDKFIGGVCSGIANYLNTDPAIVRILFAIITFGGFGLGFLIYILLWIFLPEKDMEGYFGKRLFRNPDDRVIGGVAGGLAAYFNSRSSVIRLILAAPLILSMLINFLDNMTWSDGFNFVPNIVFGSLSGTFILAYIVLWIVLPEARSPYEKMEMRGEKVDVNTIRQNVKEGMENVKDRVSEWGNEVKDSAQNIGNKARDFANTRGKTFATEVGHAARRSGQGIGHAIGVLFKVLFFFIAGTIAFGLFVAFIVLLFSGIAWWPMNNFLWTSSWQQLYAWGTVILFFGVPLIALITWLIRRIMRIRSRRSYLGWTFGFLWTLGWVSAILLAVSLTKDFRKLDYSEEEAIITQPVNGRMLVAVSDPELVYRGNFSWINDEGDGWDLSDDTLKLSTVIFTFNPAKDQLYHVKVKKHSYGRTSAEARERARKVSYSVTSIDSVLDVASGYAIDKDSKFRGQYVEIEILIPPGKKIRFDRSVNQKLNPNFRIRTYPDDRRVEIRFHDDIFTNRFRTGVDYVMGVDGTLQDTAGNRVYRDDYRYEGQYPVTDTTIETLPEKKKRLQEEQKRAQDELKRIEEEEKKSKPISYRDEKTTKSNKSINSFSPGFSLAKSYF